jgi:CUB/sushi domain-containing protein
VFCVLTEIICSPLPEVAFATAMPCDRRPGSSCQMKCQDSHIAVRGNETRTCLADGTWDGSDLQCYSKRLIRNYYKLMTTCIIAAVVCANPGFPEHGSRSGNKFILNKQVHFRCHPGYRLQGDASIQCLSTGRWNALRPMCQGQTASQLQIKCTKVCRFSDFSLPF